eukprot:SAG22_NODE_1626_length_3956_cov_2.706767_6_plen_81_part_00
MAKLEGDVQHLLVELPRITSLQTAVADIDEHAEMVEGRLSEHAVSERERVLPASQLLCCCRPSSPTATLLPLRSCGRYCR